MNTSLKQHGPQTLNGQTIHRDKYQTTGDASFTAAMERVAAALQDGDIHRRAFKEILLEQRFLPAGRVQSAMGAPINVTAYNCFVSGDIPDSMDGIYDALKDAAMTMRMGGGIGYNFSTLRPKGDLIAGVGSRTQGPLVFMDVFDASCGAISSAGHRRGAQMGVLNVDHPDIEAFIVAKHKAGRLTRFNVSVGITDEFIEAVKSDSNFDLKFEGRVYKTVRATYLWDLIMRSTWDHAEPGVLFMDRYNSMNNLKYCELISATNPCAEQGLPPYGACLLGSINLTKYIQRDSEGGLFFDEAQMVDDIPHVVRAMDNIVDRTMYPLPQQEYEATSKRRMGIGMTGLANTLTALGLKYDSVGGRDWASNTMRVINEECYRASIRLAMEKGPFPLFDADKYCEGAFIKTLPEGIQADIRIYGIRNSHLTSIAPTGTISMTADNVSSGIEPPFSWEQQRTIETYEGPTIVNIKDYAVNEWGLKGQRSDDISVEAHVDMMCAVQEWVDSSVSKTCNVADDITFDEFKAVYMRAYDGGAKGCTTFRAAGFREGILKSADNDNAPPEDEGEVCVIDENGQKSCAY